jgi:serine/threonine-protein kinase
VPPAIGALLRRALEKHSRERLRDIGDARLELASARAPAARGSAASPIAAPVSETATRRSASRLLPLATFAAGVLVATGLLRLLPARTPEAVASPPSMRTSITLPPETAIVTGRGSSVALSPDGSTLVFVGRAAQITRLYLRPLGRFDALPLAGTEDATNPFFSPDGRWIGFFADRKLKKVSIDGGAPVALADVLTPRGEAWLADDSILITPANNAGVSRVPALGGAPEPFTQLAAGEMSHRWPRAIAGGPAVLFTIWNDTGWEPSRVAIQSAGEPAHRVLVEGGGYARAVRDPVTGRSYLVYARAEGVMAAPFDVDRLAVTGPSVPIVDNVITNLSGGAHFDVAGDTLAYVPGTLGEADRDLVWVTLDGKTTPARRVPRMSQDFSLSPDATRILRNNTVGSRDIWIDDLTREVSTRVTNAAENFAAIWSPDAQWIAFARGVPNRNLYRRSLNPGALDQRLTTSPNWQQPTAISPDGTKLVYTEIDPISSMDIWVLDLPRPESTGTARDTTPQTRPYLKTNFSENEPALSSDGRWLAYQSNESGRFEVYVRSFPDAGPAHQVSTEGGLYPMWSRDGSLFYRSSNGKMMAVAVDTANGFHTGTPKLLFDVSRFDNTYGVAPDGKRLLMMRAFDAEQPPTIVSLVQNFTAELRQRIK